MFRRMGQTRTGQSIAQYLEHFIQLLSKAPRPSITATRDHGPVRREGSIGQAVPTAANIGIYVRS
jgi:hypothetical protein